MYNANQDFSKEMQRLNALEDTEAHMNLQGKVFKRKTLDPSKVYGLGYFGIAGMTYLYFPYVANVFGYALTTLGICSTSIAGMFSFQEKDVINSIEYIKEGEHQGKLKINISKTGILFLLDIFGYIWF